MVDIKIPQTHFAPLLQKIANQNTNKAIFNADKAIDTFKTSGIIDSSGHFVDPAKNDNFLTTLFDKGSSINSTV